MTESIMSNITKEQLQEAVDHAYNLTSVLEYLGYKKPRANMFYNLKKKCDSFNIDYSKLLDEKKNPKARIRYSDEQIFVKDSPVSQDTVRKRFIKGKYQEYKCSLCGINEWQNKPLTLRLDHIDGDKTNNDLSNLRWVCPNCDSQLPTYCNKGEVNELGESIPKHSYCIDCGKKIWYGATRCVECKGVHSRKAERPERDILKKLIRTESFKAIGRKYGVEDNTIRKWCRSMNLPSRKKDIKLYSDEDWDKL